MAVIARRGAGFSIRGMRIPALVLFAVALVGLGTARDRSDDSRLAAPRAEAAALHDARVQRALRGGYTRVRTMPFDERTVRVSFFDGPRAVAEAVAALSEMDATTTLVARRATATGRSCRAG